MKYGEVRIAIIHGLSAYMQCQVCLSNQVQPEIKYPFIIYASTAPYIPEAGMGEYSARENADGARMEVRREEPTCTMSFTACSCDRMGKEQYIFGEEEALDLAERAQGWFLHAGYDYLSGKGITVVDVANVQERSFLQVDEEARRYGFDVMLRYEREDERPIEAMKTAVTIEKGESK